MSRFQHTLASLFPRRSPTRMPSISSTSDGGRASAGVERGPNACPGLSTRLSKAAAAGGCPFAQPPQSGPAASPLSGSSQCPVSGRFAPTSAPPAWLAASVVPVPAVARQPSELEQLWNEPAASVLYIPPLLSRLPDTPLTATLYSPPSSLPDSAVSWTDSHLPAIDTASHRLHDALRHFRPVTNAYAFVPYADAFNWSEMDLGLDTEREWYVVAFRSLRAPEADPERLGRADRLAHEEAVTNGGLLGYWYGNATCNEKGANLATCIWMSRAHALAANTGPRHREAIALAKVSCATSRRIEVTSRVARRADSSWFDELQTNYTTFALERYVLRKVTGVRHVTVHDWEGGEVAF